jgi:hypothetical protein
MQMPSDDENVVTDFVKGDPLSVGCGERVHTDLRTIPTNKSFPLRRLMRVLINAKADI